MAKERKLLPDVVDLVRKFKLERGGHATVGGYYEKDPKKILDIDNRLCIMEMVGVLQGQGVSVAVPCVSGVITEAMIWLNDALPQGEQEKLIDLIPYILHTAPVLKSNRPVVSPAELAYYNIEDKRDLLLNGVKGIARLCCDHGVYNEGTLDFSSAPVLWDQVVSLIKEAADLKRWEEVV